MSRLRLAETAAAVAVAAGILVLTTAPWQFSGPASWESCLVCGSAGGADAVLNTWLFVPLGYLLTRAGLPWRTATVLSIVGSLLIETAQSYQPDRYATAGDMLANGLGALVGASLAASSGDIARRLDSIGGASGLLLAAPGVLVLLATAWLYQPSLPVSTYYGQWTADLGQFAHFPGAVTDARVGPQRVPVGMGADSEQLREDLLDGAPIAVRVRPEGPPPSRPAPIFSIFDDRQREIVFMGAAGTDGLARVRLRAAGARLHWPYQVAPGLLAGAHEGEERVFEWRERDAGGCLAWGDRRVCGIRESVARGWALVVPTHLGATAWIADGLWLALLFAPLGCARRSSSAMFGATLLVLMAVGVPPIMGIGPVSAAAWIWTGVVIVATFLTIRPRDARTRPRLNRSRP